MIHGLSPAREVVDGSGFEPPTSRHLQMPGTLPAELPAPLKHRCLRHAYDRSIIEASPAYDMLSIKAPLKHRCFSFRRGAARLGHRGHGRPRVVVA